MLFIRLRKIIGDFKTSRTQTFFVILAIAVGVFGFSTVVNSYSILIREMDKNYMNTNPASATLWTSTADESYMLKVASLPYIKDAEQRTRLFGRVQTGENQWKDICLFVIKDFKNLRLDKFSPEKGKTIPSDREILLERKAINIAKAELGQVLAIRIPGESSKNLEFSGTVHAPGLAPAWMEGFAYGFISDAAYKYLGGSTDRSEIKIQVTGDTMDKNHISNCVYKLKAQMEKDGFRVYRTDIPRPGKHPHYDQMATLLFLMEAFGFLALILSAIMAANMISAVLKQQVRQIGIMKAIGASSIQISGLYTGMVIILSLAGTIIGLLPGLAAGRNYSWIAAELLNFKIFSYDIPYYIFILEIAIGLAIPLLTASVSIFNGSRITVRQAINDYGINQEKYGGWQWKMFNIFPNSLPRPLLLSIRNTFRRRGRLVFTMLVMAAGGTGFITAMNIYASMYYTVDLKIDSISYDIQVSLDRPQDSSYIIKELYEIPGVLKAEAWSGTSGTRVNKNGKEGSSFAIYAPPQDSTLLTSPPIYNGRWLSPQDKNAIVINQRILSNEPDLKVGNSIRLMINQKESTWKIIGISKELIGLPSAYVNSEYLSEILNNKGKSDIAVIALKKRDSVTQNETAGIIEKKLNEDNNRIRSLIKVADYRKAIEDHLLLIATFLIIMSVLVVIVGGLGLATTISINTIERTREIGIMRAIGATSFTITGITVTEGVVIGILSWLASIIISWPVSTFTAYNFGMLFFEAPLEFTFSIMGLAIWFGIVILFAAAASFYPSWKASYKPVRDALTYE